MKIEPLFVKKTVELLDKKKDNKPGDKKQKRRCPTSSFEDLLYAELNKL